MVDFTKFASLLDNKNIKWKSVVTTLLLGEFVFESYIQYRQYKVYQRTEPPVSIAKEVEKDVFLKSQEYSQAKSRFGFVKNAFNVVKELLVIRLDVVPLIWSYAGNLSLKLSSIPFIGQFIGTSIMSQSLSFAALQFGLANLISLPFSYYNTFEVEERFGFNKHNVRSWAKDTIKNWAVQFVLNTMINYGVLWIVHRYGKSFVAYASVFVLVIQLFFSTIYPDFILPLFYELKPLEEGDLRSGIEALARKNNFPLTELFVVDGSSKSAHSNAMFIGMPWKKKVIIYDTLIEQNTTEGTVAVLAHEIGHWKLNHIPQRLLAGQATSAVTFILVTAFLENESSFNSFGFFNEYPAIVAFTFFEYVNAPVAHVAGTLFNLLIRKGEYEADEYAKNQGYAEDLAKALIKMSAENLDSYNSDWLYSVYTESHPILADRLNAIGYVSKERIGETKVDVEVNAETDIEKEKI